MAVLRRPMASSYNFRYGREPAVRNVEIATILINDILNSYRFRGSLRRVPFVVSVVSLSIVLGYVSFKLRQTWHLGGGSDYGYLAMAFGTEVLIALLVLPLCAARLRDIGWPSYASVLILLSPLVSLRLIVLIAHNNGGTFSPPFWYTGAIAVASVVLLIFLMLLTFRKGTNQT